METTADLMYKFNHTHQQKGESISGYITRVDRMLHQIILKKGIDLKGADHACLDRVLQRAQTIESPARMESYIGEAHLRNQRVFVNCSSLRNIDW